MLYTLAELAGISMFIIMLLVLTGLATGVIH